MVNKLWKTNTDSEPYANICKKDGVPVNDKGYCWACDEYPETKKEEYKQR